MCVKNFGAAFRAASQVLSLELQCTLFAFLVSVAMDLEVYWVRIDVGTNYVGVSFLLSGDQSKLS